MHEAKETKRKLFEEVSMSFGENLLRAMLVSETDEDGGLRKLTQQELAEKSGVGRSTIAKYNTLKKNGDSGGNPDLETICKLAGALHVPPALLLMKPSDWSHLIQAALYLSVALDDGIVQEIAAEIENSKAKDAKTMAQFGLKLAIRLGIYKEYMVSPENALEMDTIRISNMKIKKGILATTTLPPLAKITKRHIVPLMSLCAIIGAHQNPTV